MQPYRFDGLVQGRLLQLQLALFILVKVIATLDVTHQDTELDKAQARHKAPCTSGLR